MKPTCVPIRPFYHPKVDGTPRGWLFRLTPGWKLPRWPEPLTHVIVHVDGVGGLRVCKAMYIGPNSMLDWGVPVFRVEAQEFLDTYFTEITAVMDLGGKP